MASSPPAATTSQQDGRAFVSARGSSRAAPASSMVPPLLRHSNDGTGLAGRGSDREHVAAFAPAAVMMNIDVDPDAVTR